MSSESSDSDSESSSGSESQNVPMDMDDGIVTVRSSQDRETTDQKIQRLENDILANPYRYECYLELLDIYQRKSDLDRLRTVREKFSERFPLTPELWTSWIDDELRIATTEKEQAHVKELFERAIEDYVSVDLCFKFCQFILSSKDPEAVRNVYEQALRSAGLHFTSASLLWDSYRIYEQALFDVIVDAESEEWARQARRVFDLYKRQLSVPLRDMDHTYVEWRVWMEKLPKKDIGDAAQIEWAYKKAQTHAAICEKYEQELLEAKDNTDKLNIYREYIKAEKDPNRVICVYERAIAEKENCLIPDIWLEYCHFIIGLSDHEGALRVCRRAIRNLPYCCELRILQMRILELLERNHDEITKCMEEALALYFGQNDSLQLWFAYIEHGVRTISEDKKTVDRLRKTFALALQHMDNYFGPQGDPEFTIQRFWARVEASRLRNMNEARSIWNEILKEGNSRLANLWLEFCSLEERYGDDKHARKTYARALTTAEDWPQYIAQAWLTFERERGTLQTLMSCVEQCSRFLKVFKPPAAAAAENSQDPFHRLFPSGASEKRKRKHFEDLKNITRPSTDAPEPNITQRAENLKLESDHSQVSTPEPEPKRRRIEITSEIRDRCVFVSNIGFDVTEQQLRDFLGPVEDLNLVLDYKGNSRGFAYVVLGAVEEAQNLLKRDRERLDGRPVFISKCQESREKRKPQFNFSTDTEKHKLFVRGLPLDATKEEVEELFRQYGELRDVRIVTYRNGHSKGLAYVEFAESKDASKAMLAMDGKEIRGRTIGVAISAPPPRKTNASLAPNPATRHSKSRIEVPLVPRSVQMKEKPQEEKPSTSMSNADFRQMLLGKKQS